MHPARNTLAHLMAVGAFPATIDSGLGVLHTDQAARDSLALDVLEAIRPDIDRWVLQTIETHTFRKADFYETRRGVFRVGTDLARAMAETLPTWRRLLAPIVEGCAMAFASSSDKPLRVAMKVTETRRNQGRGKRSSKPLRLAACRECGVILHDSDRTICDDCFPEYDRERTDKLSNAGKATLAAMRASPDDPAHSHEARRRRSSTSHRTSSAMRAWEREHGKLDPHFYKNEVFPLIQQMTVPQLLSATGLSQFHRWKVRKGDRRLHARHWQAIPSRLPQRSQARFSPPLQARPQLRFCFLLLTTNARRWGVGRRGLVVSK